MAASSGDSRSLTGANRPASAASATPSPEASAKPARMCPSVNSIERQKSAVRASTASRASVSTGEASSMRWPTDMAASCHSASQKAAAASRRRAR